MKILCISDTHLENQVFKNINNKYPTMDFYIHCGDSSLSKEDPLLKQYYVVKGNHDDTDFPLEISIMIDQYRCLILHGNHHDVYYGNQKIVAYMKEKSIDICFHGHTHIPAFTHENDKYIINPGSVMVNRASYGYGTYAIISIEEKNLDVQFYHHLTHQNCTHEVLLDGQSTLHKIQELLKETKK